jgi:hypothetical protein
MAVALIFEIDQPPKRTKAHGKPLIHLEMLKKGAERPHDFFCETLAPCL